VAPYNQRNDPGKQGREQGEVLKLIYDWISRCFTYTKENKLKCFAFVVSSAGAFCVASKDYNVQLIGFSLWIVSNIAWLSIGLEEKDYPLFLTFLVYFVFNAWGIFNRIVWC
jgi:hypothetical protein